MHIQLLVLSTAICFIKLAIASKLDKLDKLDKLEIIKMLENHISYALI